MLPFALVYNTDLLKATGDQPPTTWTQFVDTATMDGAGPFDGLFRITLPIIWPTLALAALLSTIFHFNNFALPFVMFGTPPPPATDVLPVTVYINSFQVFNFGLGSAMSVLSLLVILIPSGIYICLVRLGAAQ